MSGQASQRNHPAHCDAAAVDGWHELSVANPTLLLESLGSECTDLQGPRELTVNGLDAIAALGDRAGGQVVGDMDSLRFDASAGRVRKLSVTDAGTGVRRREAAIWASTCHVVAVFGNELYDNLPRTRGGCGRFRSLEHRSGVR